MKKLTVCRSAIATTEESESETFAVRRVKTRPSVTSSRTIESRPFKSTSRLARNGGRSRPAADYGDANSRNPPLSKAYLDMVNRMPEVMGWLYDHLDKPWKNERRRLALDKLNTRPLVNLLKEYEP